jgi:hypothetical protein
MPYHGFWSECFQPFLLFFDMAIGTLGRAAFVAGPFGCFMALDAMFVHHLLFNQCTCFFEALDAALLLGEKGVANLTILQGVLMQVVGEWNHPATAAFEHDL